MTLHARRRRQRELTERETAGEDLWTEEFSPSTRVRVGALMAELAWGVWASDDVATLGAMFMSELGVELEISERGWFSDLQELFTSDIEIEADLYPSLIEALVTVHRNNDRDFGLLIDFERGLNDLMAEERIAFRLVEGQMVEFQSMAIHTEVVEPAIRLLHRSAGWENVEKSYRSALAEVGEDPSDAITDAGTALQEALTLLGCKGNALGPLAKDAGKRGLFAPHDATVNGAIEKLVHWVSADRSEKGDGHKASAATRDDAWLAVHVVGALILRLASDDAARGST